MVWNVHVVQRGCLSIPGRVLVMCLQVSSSLQSFLQNMTELEIQMNSVERVRFFSEQVSQEAPYVRDKVEQAAGRGGVSPWPSAGVVRFQNVSARYRPELPRVLHGLSIDVGTAQKVGVCGRTGSGKSTLMLLLFRILELDEGSIEIDGVDISTLGLSQLRRYVIHSLSCCTPDAHNLLEFSQSAGPSPCCHKIQSFSLERSKRI